MSKLRAFAARRSTSSLGTAFCYENSNGLAEIAVKRGRADRDLGLVVDSEFQIIG